MMPRASYPAQNNHSPSFARIMEWPLCENAQRLLCSSWLNVCYKSCFVLRLVASIYTCSSARAEITMIFITVSVYSTL